MEYAKNSMVKRGNAPERKDDQEDMGKLMGMIESSKSGHRDSLELGCLAHQYYHGCQFTEEEEAEIRKTGRQAIVINKTEEIIETAVGLIASQNPRWTAKPRKPQDSQNASTVTGLLRYTQSSENWPQVYQDLAYDFLLGPWCCVFVGADPNFRRIDYESVILDPASRERDSSDAAFIGIRSWLTFSEIKDKYSSLVPDLKKEELTPSGDFEQRGDLYETSRDGSRILRYRIHELYFKDGGEWQWAVFTADKVLVSGVSPYVDADGEPECPVLVYSAKVNRKTGSREGIFRSIQGPQKSVNELTSRIIASFGARTLVAERSAFEGPAGTRQAYEALNFTRGVVPLAEGATIDQLNILEAGKDIPAYFSMLTEHMRVLDGMGGVEDSILGSNGLESGVAVSAKQKQAATEMAPTFHRLKSMSLAAARKCYARYKQFWTDEGVVRVTGKDGADAFVAYNDPQNGYLSSMDVDIILDERPSDQTAFEERQAALQQALPNMGNVLPPRILARLLIESLPHLEDRVELTQEAMQLIDQTEQQSMIQSQAQAQQAQLAAQREEVQIQVMLQQVQSDAQKLQAEAQNFQLAAAQKQAEIQQTIQETLQKLPAEVAKLLAEAEKADAQAAGIQAEILSPAGNDLTPNNE